MISATVQDRILRPLLVRVFTTGSMYPSDVIGLEASGVDFRSVGSISSVDWIDSFRTRYIKYQSSLTFGTL
jgi:hypothetical protein